VTPARGDCACRTVRDQCSHATRTGHPPPHRRPRRRDQGALPRRRHALPEAAPRTDSAAGTPATPPAPADGDAGGRLAAVVHLADRTPRPARDGGTRHGQSAPIDAQNRVSLGKALSALDSDQQTGSCSPARCPRPRR
jgi:hypothetical protein